MRASLQCDPSFSRYRGMTCDIHGILKLEVPIIVQMAERDIPVSEVVAWVPGAIIELNKNVEDELVLLANNVPIGTGVAVKIGENFGIKLSSVGNLQDRIEAMGGSMTVEDDPADVADEEADALAEQFLAGQI